MFNPTQIVIAAFVDELNEMYTRTYGVLGAELSRYHQLRRADRTGKHRDQRRGLPRCQPHHHGDACWPRNLPWQAHQRRRRISTRSAGYSNRCSLVSMGYVRGICEGDENGFYVSNLAGDKVTVPDGATDASMTPCSWLDPNFLCASVSVRLLVAPQYPLD